MSDTQYEPQEIEHKWQERWSESGLFKAEENSANPKFYGLEFFPYPSGDGLSVGHCRNYIPTDVICRYKRMRGFNVFFPLCADVNGMPIEVSTEKKYGVNRKNTPRQKLIEICNAFAQENIAEMTRQFKILGHCMDPSIYYQTNSPEYRRITQLSFLVMFKRGLVYKKEFPVTWCPHCGTALSSADVEYQDRTTKLNFLKFHREDGGTEIIATTRPELLCACQMVAINPDDQRQRHLLGRSLLTPLYRKKVPVQDDDNVDPDFGTGIVMICTIGDKDDLEWVHRYNLTIDKGIDAEGRMTSLAGPYAGMTIREARDAIINDLRGQGLIVRQEELAQSVGTCWRCHTPVEFLSVPQWFLKTIDFKQKIIEKSNELKWFPEFMKVRLENWTSSLAWDWCISRQRYFATAIPVWECQKCGHPVPASPAQCYVDPTVSPPPVPACPDCGGRLKGVEDVFDTWMDSSITPLYNTYWRRDKDKFLKLFPMSLRAQAHDIIRTWAFYTILRHLLLLDSLPWNEIMISGFIMAPDGTPMHTSKGNVIDPLPMLDKYGADAFRYYAAACTLGMDHAFQSKEVVHGGKLVLKLWNISKFIERSAGPFPIKPVPPSAKWGATDRWILSTFSGMVERATTFLEAYQFDKAMREIEGFMWHEFADHYIEMVKHRKDDSMRYTLYTVGLGLTKLMAPFMPHVTEEIFDRLFRQAEGGGSIHTSGWPEPMPRDPDVEKKGAKARDVIAKLRAWKGSKGLRLGQPIGLVHIFGTDSELLGDFLEDIKGTLRAKDVLLSRPEGLREEPDKLVPVRPKIGPVFKAKANSVVDAIGALAPKEAAERLASAGKLELTLADGTKAEIARDMVRVEMRSMVGDARVEIVQGGEMTIIVESGK